MRGPGEQEKEGGIPVLQVSMYESPGHALEIGHGERWRFLGRFKTVGTIGFQGCPTKVCGFPMPNQVQQHLEAVSVKVFALLISLLLRPLASPHRLHGGLNVPESPIYAVEPCRDILQHIGPSEQVLTLPYEAKGDGYALIDTLARGWYAVVVIIVRRLTVGRLASVRPMRQLVEIGEDVAQGQRMSTAVNLALALVR